MGSSRLHCLFISHDQQYPDLIEVLDKTHYSYQIKTISPIKSEIIKEIRHLKKRGLIFVPADLSFSLELLSDIIWQSGSDVTVVILTNKQTSPLHSPFHNTQFAKLDLERDSAETVIRLQYLFESVKIKAEFRRCKRLLAISEKRCQWLVASSRAAVAYISRDTHLYANNEYLRLFGVVSNSRLHGYSVTDFILKNEHHLYESYQNDQLKISKDSKTLILTMVKKNHRQFRARISLVASVYKGNKCFQIRVENLTDSTEEELTTSPMDVDDRVSKVLDKKSLGQNDILRQILKSGSISIHAQKLLVSKGAKLGKEQLYYLLRLNASDIQTISINKLLPSQLENNSADIQSIFWEKVKISRALQIIKKRSLTDSNYLISISEASIKDSTFIDWLNLGLNKIGKKAASLIFLLPSQIEAKYRKDCIHFANTLQSHQCKIGMNDFFVSVDTVQMLKHLNPEFIYLSVRWIKTIEGNEHKEISLSRIVRKLESKNNKVIAPCSLSAEMRRLFILSGASFCL